ncbi:MAG: DUF6011 domain-containing protein [Limnohabitans sp.]
MAVATTIPIDTVPLTARFDSTCAACWKRISTGEKLQWSRAMRKAWHSECPTQVLPKPEGMEDEGRLMPSRFGGKCANCHGRFDEGDMIRYCRPTTFHAGCPAVVTPDPKQSDVDLSALPYGTYRFAVGDKTTGKLRFLLVDLVPPVDAQGHARQYGGNVYVREQAGGGMNHERLGRQLKGQKYVGEGADLLAEILRDPEAAARRYGTELGECSVCGTQLTEEKSRELGIGPVCRKRFTWSGGRVAHQPDADAVVA